MELREWLIILGLALVTLIVIDGVRRLKRQRQVPRLDQVGDDTSFGGRSDRKSGKRDGGSTREASLDDEDAKAEAEINWELPNGGARVVTPASYATVKPKPKLQRQEHPGPSRVLAGLNARAADKATPQRAAAPARPEVDAPARATDSQSSPDQPAALRADDGRAERAEEAKAASGANTQQAAQAGAAGASAEPETSQPSAAPSEREAQADHAPREPEGARQEPTLSALDDEPVPANEEPLAADPAEHEAYHDDDDERYRLVDLEGMGDTLKSGSRRMGSSMQRFGDSVQQHLAKRRERRREEKLRQAQAREEKAARDAQRKREEEAQQAARQAERELHEAQAAHSDADDPLFATSRGQAGATQAEPLPEEQAAAPDDDVVRAHPTLARALRHDVSAERVRNTLSNADEVIVISVMSRDEAGFSGAALLELMLACGLRYSREMGIFHRFETEEPDSELQFSMVNVLKPGTFPIEAMDDFITPGVTLLMPLPGAVDTAAAFEAMVETAMVIVRHLGGELKDENHSVMTAQTVEFARQRVQEFERRHRLNRCQVN